MIRLIAFDWGNTLMPDDPNSTTPMVEWPELSTMPGIIEALQQLQPDYRLIIASNALISTVDQVWEALRRVDLHPYFETILTAKAIGLSKPDPAYYQYIANLCGGDPAEVVMVGDTYATDILGAKRAGLRTVWYNAAAKTPPPDAPDAADVEIRDLLDLPDAIRALDQTG